MATIALPRPLAPHCSSSTQNTVASGISLDVIAVPTAPTSATPPSIPNKHLPSCPTGPRPKIDSRPSSPSELDQPPQASLLYPPSAFPRVDYHGFTLYEIDASGVAAAVDYTARQPLPDPSLVFPWLHGLHPQNQIQQTFFLMRRRGLRRTPSCLRGVTLVKADGDLTSSRLKGAIAPDEFLDRSSGSPEFIDIDPRDGFSVRNFQIQTAKAAMTSDIIVYGCDKETIISVAKDIAEAQQRRRLRHSNEEQELPEYNTFVCIDPFHKFEEEHVEIVAVDSTGALTGQVVDFFYQERREMYSMTKATEISHNVWIGPSPDHSLEDEHQFDILIECTDLASLNPSALRAVLDAPENYADKLLFDFPSSGSISPPTWSQADADEILETCKWIYHLANGTRPISTAPAMSGSREKRRHSSQPSIELSGHRPRKILLHCPDGYTESTLLAIAYYSYSTGLPVPDAWLSLHTVMKRNFFAYVTDVVLLRSICARLLRESPVCSSKSPREIAEAAENEPGWMPSLDGSLPSRVLDYMYLGNVNHANNPELLSAMGIGQILSVGETATWREGELDHWGEENVYTVQGVQDNGIDSLAEEFERCLEFIDRGRRNGTATLVHCRVGVSRSATICIAEVMRALNMSFPRAYCFVRARRLNVIIQPHLRFAYELLRWEERLQKSTNPSGFKRELEWAEIAREIALMNRPYTAK